MTFYTQETWGASLQAPAALAGWLGWSARLSVPMVTTQASTLRITVH